MALTRHADWVQRLDGAVRAARRVPFQWGTHDCCLFAADVILAMTGTDVAAQWRGKYSDEAGAMAVLKGIGGAGIGPAVTVLLGAPLKFPLLAGRGDIGIVPISAQGGIGGDALGVVLGSRVAVAAPTGIAFIGVSALRGRTAWRV